MVSGSRRDWGKRESVAAATRGEALGIGRRRAACVGEKPGSIQTRRRTSRRLPTQRRFRPSKTGAWGFDSWIWRKWKAG